MAEEDVNLSLVSAVRGGRLKAAEELIDKYGLSHCKEWSDGYTLLCDALRCNKIKIAKLLLRRGARVTWEGRCFTTPLHNAAIIGDVEIVEMIVDRGGNINAKDKTDRTPLLHAIIKNKVEVTKFFLDHGACVNAKNNHGSTLLHVACYMGHTDIVRLLLENGALVNCKDNSGITPLHDAARNGHKKVVESIIQYGADINSMDGLGRTALHIASQEDKPFVIETLLEYGSDVNIINKNDGLTAVSHNRKRLKVHINLDTSNERGLCPFNEAANIFGLHIVKMLAAKFYVCEQNKSLFFNDCDDYEDGFGQYSWLKACEKEVEKLKREKLSNTNISFYDIIAKSTNWLAKYMDNKNVASVLKSGDYRAQFNIYARMIHVKFENCVRRKKLLDKGISCLDSLFSFLDVRPRLPQDILVNIILFFNDEELKNFVTSWENSDDCTSM